MQSESQVFRNVVCGSIIGIAVACGPSAQKQLSEPIQLLPTSLSAPTRDEASDEAPTGDEKLALVLTHDLQLIPSMSEVGLSEEYSAYIQDGISKHGRRSYTDAQLSPLLRDRPFCVVRFRPFENDEQRRQASIKVKTQVLSERLRSSDLARSLQKGQRLTFVVDHKSAVQDEKLGLTSLLLYPSQQQIPYILKMKCVGAAEMDIRDVLSSAFAVRRVRRLE